MAALLLQSSPDSSGKALMILPNLSPILIHFISLYRANKMMRERKHLKIVEAYVNVKVVAITEALAQCQLLKKKIPLSFLLWSPLQSSVPTAWVSGPGDVQDDPWRESKKSLEFLYLYFSICLNFYFF